MFSNKFFYIFLIIILLVIIAFIVVHSGLFPVLSINGTWVSYQDYQNQYDAVRRLPRLLASNLTSLKIADDKTAINATEIKKITITKFIEDSLVLAEAKKILGSQFDTLMDQQLQAPETFNYIDFSQSELDRSAFTSFIARPFLAHYVVVDNFTHNGINFDDWLEKQMKASTIKIFLPGVKILSDNQVSVE